MRALASKLIRVGQLLLVFLLLWSASLAETVQVESAPSSVSGEFCGSAQPPDELLSCPKTLGPRCYCSLSAKKAPPGGDLNLERNHQRAGTPRVRRPGVKPRVLPRLTVAPPTLEVYPGVPKPPPRA